MLIKATCSTYQILFLESLEAAPRMVCRCWLKRQTRCLLFPYLLLPPLLQHAHREQEGPCFAVLLSSLVQDLKQLDLKDTDVCH